MQAIPYSILIILSMYLIIRLKALRGFLYVLARDYKQLPGDVYKHGSETAFKIVWMIYQEFDLEHLDKALLSAVVQNKDAQTLKYLLSHGLNVNQVITEGNNVLMLSIENKADELIQQILLSGTDTDIHAVNNGGESSLNIALRNSLDIKVIERLLQFGANPNQPTQGDIDFPLLLAFVKNDLELMELLVKYGAQCNGDVADHMLELFSKINGFHVNLMNKFGWFHDTKTNGLTKAVIYDEPILDEDSKLINVQDGWGLTAAHYAVMLDRPAVLKKLMAMDGMDIQAIENIMLTPLIQTSLISGSTRLLPFLMSLNGAKLPSGFYSKQFVTEMIDLNDESQYAQILEYIIANKNKDSILYGFNSCGFRSFVCSAKVSHKGVETFVKQCKDWLESYDTSINQCYGLYAAGLHARPGSLLQNMLPDMQVAITTRHDDFTKQIPLPQEIFKKEILSWLRYSDYMSLFEASSNPVAANVSRGTNQNKA